MKKILTISTVVNLYNKSTKTMLSKQDFEQVIILKHVYEALEEKDKKKMQEFVYELFPHAMICVAEVLNYTF